MELALATGLTTGFAGWLVLIFRAVRADTLIAHTTHRLSRTRRRTQVRLHQPLCRCGHQQAGHTHYRRGRDCSICGPIACPWYRPRPRNRPVTGRGAA